MGWEDRPYYRDRSSASASPLMWIFAGSVPLGTWFGIRVRMHASLLLLIVLTLLFPQEMGGVYTSFSAMVILFGIVVLHEFGHCVASRMVGGDPRDILLTPLGGLAFADAPRRPWATFWTVAGGPLVNVIICLLCAVTVALMGYGWGLLPFNPLDIRINTMVLIGRQDGKVPLYLWQIFSVSYGLLLFNLWPVFPLDGGQLLQSLLWVKFGYYKSMKFATRTGMVGAVVMGALGLASRRWLLVVIAISGFITCLNLWRQLMAMGPEEMEDAVDYSASLRPVRTKSRKAGRRAIQRVKKLAEEEAAEQVQIDTILAKVSAKGMHSLTWGEKRALKKATERQRKRDAEIGRARRSSF